MPLPAVPTAAATAIVYEQFGQEMVNVIKWSGNEVLTVTEITTLANQTFTTWASTVMPFLSFQTIMQRVECRQLVPLAGIAVEAVGSGPEAGQILIDADNSQNCTVISLRTGLAGRSFRGRLYLPGLPNDQVQNGLVLEAYRTDLAQAVGDAISTIAAAAGLVPVVLSYFNAKAQRVTPVASPIENVISTTPYPGVQRRRRVGVGN